MVVVKIELWPHGDQTKSRTLGVMSIANDGTGSVEQGNYKAELSHAGVYYGRKPGAWKRGMVLGYRRTLSPYHLVSMALKACGIIVK